MRSQNIELKKSIYDFVNTWKRKYGGSPILSVIAKEMGVDKSTVSRYLKRMNEDGVIYYDGTTIETKEVNSHNSCLSKAMIVGSIPCGEPTLEEEYVEEYLNLPESFFGKGEFYILRAKGDSMEDAGICEGDLVIIKKQCTAEVGDIIVALDGDNQNTLKRYGGITKKGEAVLEYMNEAVYPGKTIRVKTLVVQGVAEHVLKSL